MTVQDRRSALRKAIDALRDLDLAKLRQRLRDAKAQRGRKKAARRDTQDRRDDKREKLEALLDTEPLTPDQQRTARELEEQITQLDKHAELLHNVITRRTQLIRRLKPKNLKRTKRRKELADRIKDRRKKLRAAIKRHRNEQAPTTGIVTFDGKPCAAWIAADLQKIRAAGWDGYLVSGWRSPEYSESLCYGICGAPVCPGRCAGRSSSHSQSVRPAGAADLSLNYLSQALSLLRQVGSQLHNAIGPSDPNHVSSSGR